MVWRLPIRLTEGEKENERSEPTLTKRQRIEERVLLVRFDAHDVTIIEWRCNFSISGAFGTLSQIDYSVIGPICDSPRLRCLTFSHATATCNERWKRVHHFHPSFYLSRAMVSQWSREPVLIGAKWTSLEGILPPERITGDFDNSIFSARERLQNSRIIDSRRKNKKKKKRKEKRKESRHLYDEAVLARDRNPACNETIKSSQ